jgi:CMP/dCMP kinase
MIITIDGPAGTGKTTVARLVAERLHVPFFDTGSMYRSVAWRILKKEIPLSDCVRIEEELSTFSFHISTDGNGRRYYVGDEDVTEVIRSQPVTAIVSEVSALPCVRKALWKIQREFGEKGDAVFEGRDMGSVVFPHAEMKIFLTARAELRAQRRFQELLQKNPGDKIDQEQILAEIIRRDEYDSSRTLAPLKCPEDALLIDTSDLSIDGVVDRILEYKLHKNTHAPRL